MARSRSQGGRWVRQLSVKRGDSGLLGGVREGTSPVTGQQGELPAWAQAPSSLEMPRGCGEVGSLGGDSAANPNPREDCRLHRGQRPKNACPPGLVAAGFYYKAECAKWRPSPGHAHPPPNSSLTSVRVETRVCLKNTQKGSCGNERMRNNVGSVVVSDWAPPRCLDARAWVGPEPLLTVLLPRGRERRRWQRPGHRLVLVKMV